MRNTQKYDETFDISSMMREAGYPGEFSLPDCISFIRRRADKIPRPRGEVVSVGGFRGHRDYLEMLARESEQHVLSSHFTYSPQTDGEYENDVNNLNTTNSTSLTDNKNEVTNTLNNESISQSGSVRANTSAVASMSDGPLYQSPHILQNSTSSTSSSLHVVSSTAKSEFSMYSAPSQTSWSHTQATAMPTGFMNIGTYDSPVGYSLPNMTDTVTNHLPNDAMRSITENAVVNHQQINRGTMPVSPLPNLSDFFIENSTDQNSLPIANYHNNIVYKSDDGCGYNNGQLYSPLLSQNVYQLQHDHPIIRTAAGGECPEVVNFARQNGYMKEQDVLPNCTDFQYNMTHGNNYSNYGMLPVRMDVENMYMNTGQYSNSNPQCSTAARSQESTGSSGNLTSELVHYLIKEDPELDENSLDAAYLDR